MTETVHAYRNFLPHYAPIPHPSWRTTHWLKFTPWFETYITPEMHRRVQGLLAEGMDQ